MANKQHLALQAGHYCIAVVTFCLTKLLKKYVTSLLYNQLTIAVFSGSAAEAAVKIFIPELSTISANGTWGRFSSASPAIETRLAICFVWRCTEMQKKLNKCSIQQTKMNYLIIYNCCYKVPIQKNSQPGAEIAGPT